MFRPQFRLLHFIAIAKDNPNILPRRLEQRPMHLKRAAEAKENGFLLLGGATLDSERQMNGSILLFEADKKEDVDSFLDSDPYATGKVWEHWSVLPFQLAGVSSAFSKPKPLLHFIAIAKDKPNILPRRLEQRPMHWKRAAEAKENGFLLLGGATLDSERQMNGSILLFEADKKEDVDSFLESDPYATGKVWEHWSVLPFQLAGVSSALHK